MVGKEEIVEELNYASQILTDRSRTLNFGILALSWAIIIDIENSTLNNLPSHTFLLFSVIFSISSLILDFLQYLFAYLNTVYKSKKNKISGFDSYLKTMRTYCFYCKIVLTVVASISCLGQLINYVLE